MPPPGLLGLITRGAGALGQRLAQGGAAPAAPAAAPAVDPFQRAFTNALVNPNMPIEAGFQRAFTNALVNPNMPIEAGFQTPSAKVNADLERQARIRNQLSAGRAAIIERARAQGRQVSEDPNTGQLVIGDVPQTQIVQPGPDGTRIAYRNGMPVGFSSPAKPSAEAMRLNEPYRSNAAARAAQIEKETAALPAEQRASIAARLGVENTPAAIAGVLSAGIAASGSSVTGTPEQGEEIRRQATALAARQRASELMRSAIQKFNTTNATAGAQMTPTGGYLMTPMAGAAPAVATAPAPTMAAPVAPALPLPVAPTRPTPMASAPFRDATGRVDTEAVARAQGRIPVETAASPEQALAEAEQFMEEEPTRVAEETAQKRVKSYQEQVAETTRELTRARVRRDLNAVRRLSARLAGLVQNPPGRTATEQAERRLEETQMASFPIGG